MTITIHVIGSLKEAYWKEAEKEYLKRLSPYAKVEIIEHPDYPSKDKASPKEIVTSYCSQISRISSKCS